jgi:ATP-dependent Clp protease ATP-binding subunit ClpC
LREGDVLVATHVENSEELTITVRKKEEEVAN